MKLHPVLKGALVSFLVLTGMLTVISSVYANPGSVTWFAEDTITGGNWPQATGSPHGFYGTYAHILPNSPSLRLQVPIGNFSVPIGGDYTAPPLNWTVEQVNGLPFNRSYPPYWDEYVTKTPAVTYYVNGTFAIFSNATGDYPVQYPTFEWTWDNWHSSQTDPREVYYTIAIPGTGGGPGWRMCAWDDGGERSQPVYGYINITMYFPPGNYWLSLYAYDKEMDLRWSEEYRIYDTTGALLTSKEINNTAFDNGVYEIFRVISPPGGLTIIVQVYNKAGHVSFTEPYPGDKSNNVVLSGIFVDEIPPSVGGVVIPVDKFMVSSMLIVMSLLVVTVASLAYIKYSKYKIKYN